MSEQDDQINAAMESIAQEAAKEALGNFDTVAYYIVGKVYGEEDHTALLASEDRDLLIELGKAMGMSEDEMQIVKFDPATVLESSFRAMAKLSERMGNDLQGAEVDDD